MNQPWKHKEVIGDCTLYLGDCLQVMPALGEFDAVVTDPPYGIGEAAGKNASRGNFAKTTDYGNKDWDNSTNQPAINTAINISTKSIIFGGNYYDLPPTTCWLVWDKQNGANDFADCELAWTNLEKAVRRIYWQWNGFIRKGEMDKVKTPTFRKHPTQKPLGVMEWCINHLPDNTQTILDPFMGSGTTLVACAKMGRKGTGIELDPEYFEIACQRVRKAYDQPDMFVQQERVKPPENLELFGGGK